MRVWAFVVSESVCYRAWVRVIGHTCLPGPAVCLTLHPWTCSTGSRVGTGCWPVALHA
jgi:hypothetical protein